MRGLNRVVITVLSIIILVGCGASSHEYDGTYQGTMGNVLKIEGNTAIQSFAGVKTPPLSVDQDPNNGIMKIKNRENGNSYIYTAVIDENGKFIGFDTEMPIIGKKKAFRLMENK
ncbi:MAG: hypothetical protein ABJH72_03955 [Reichenbachiella sp.]|uniref:hypothetical protein n=1 Tax=Reichenbachiella sp. TaxID=2184521 RepID=UPI00329895AA